MKNNVSEIDTKAMMPAKNIMAAIGSKLKEQTEALKREKELKYLDDMIALKQQKLR